MDFLNDMGNWMFGGAQRNRQRVEDRHAMDMKRMQSLLDSAAGQQLLAKARAASLDRGEGYYGGRGVDPYVKGAEDLGKIRNARDVFSGEFGDQELDPETAAYFDLAESSVLDRMKPEIDPIDQSIKAAGGRKSLPKAGKGVTVPMGGVETSKSAAEYFQPSNAGKAAVAGFEMVTGMEDFKGPSLSDYFQSGTDTVPEENIPKTFQQLGISSVDDQATLQEMQKALPDRDMRDEYETDPEYMKKLIQLWKQGKLNKSNLHKAFSAIQQRARESLGVA